ncbi:hypothetical protein HKBW3S09_02028, partial [Candidatus Hakubella thermalkaliphila]
KRQKGVATRYQESWSDTGILLEGPIAGTLLSEFEKSWLFWGGKPIETAVRRQKPKIQDAGYNPPLSPFVKGGIKGGYHASEDSKLLTLNSDLPVLPIFASSSRGRRRLMIQPRVRDAEWD